MGLLLHPHLWAEAAHRDFQRFLPVLNSPNSIPSLQLAFQPQAARGKTSNSPGTRRGLVAKQPEGSNFLNAGGCCVNAQSQEARLQPQNWQLGSGTAVPSYSNGKPKWLLLPIFIGLLPLLSGRTQQGGNKLKREKQGFITDLTRSRSVL